MPIDLPPQTRRQFIVNISIAAAGLLASPNLFAATRKSDPDTWALLSDLHIAGDRTTIKANINMADHLAAAAKEILALRKLPGNLVMSGDLACRTGARADYALLRELLSPLAESGIPLTYAMGNHDNRENFWASFPQGPAPQPVPGKHVQVVRTRRANWFILDSLDKTDVTPGVLGSEQREWLARELDLAPDSPAILVFHHEPYENPTSLTDAKELLEIIRPRKQVKACIFGHSHQYEIREDTSGIHFINLPALAYVFGKDLPSGWVLATVKRNGMRLQLHTHPAHKDQGKITMLKWRSRH